MKIVRNVLVQDAPAVPNWHRRRYIRDTVLEAVPLKKVVALGTIYTGELQPQINEVVQRMDQWVTPFSLGHTLQAEPSHAELRMGQTYVGDLIVRMDDAARAYTPNGPWDGNAVDLTDVRSGLAQLYMALGTQPIDASAFAESLRRVKDARDAVHRTARTHDGSWAANPRPAERDILRGMAAAATELWKGKDAAIAANRVARAVNTAATTQDSRTQINAINEAHRTFWAARGRRR